VAGCCVLWVRNCGWMLCAVGGEVWLDVVCCGLGSVAGCCVLWVGKCGWIIWAVGEDVWLDVVCCG